MPMFHRRTSLLLVLLLAVFSAGLGSGCKKKPKTPDVTVEQDPWKDKLELLARTVPADASAAVFVVDFSAALASYQGLRTRIAAYMSDFSSIEADLRNTLGVDPARPQNLATIGIDPQGGAVCSVVQNQPLCGMILSDADAFHKHFERVLQSQPFNLRAPVVRSDLPSGGRLLRFATEEGGELKAAIVLNADMGFIILRPRAEAIEGLAATLETPAAQPLNSHPPFQSLIEHTQREAVMAWLSPNASAAAVRAMTKLGNRLPSMDNIEGALVGVRISADAFHGWFSAKIDPEDQRVRALLTRTEGLEAADFTKLVTDDAYLLLRARTEPSSLLETLRSSFADDTIEHAQKSVQNSVGADDIEQRLLAVLGSDMMIVATRARLLTIASLARGGAVNARALGDGLGLIMAYQLKDSAGAKQLLQDIATARPQAVTFQQVDAETESWTINEGQAAGTVILIIHDLLIASTQRQVSEIVFLMHADTAPVLKEISAQEALELRTKTEDIGLFIDLKRVANNSIGQVAGGQLSPSLRDALQVFDEFWMRADVVDSQWLDGSYRIQLSTPARQ